MFFLSLALVGGCGLRDSHLPCLSILLCEVFSYLLSSKNSIKFSFSFTLMLWNSDISWTKGEGGWTEIYQHSGSNNSSSFKSDVQLSVHSASIQWLLLHWWANRFFSTWFHLSEQRITSRAVLCTHLYMYMRLFDFMLFNLCICVCACVFFSSFLVFLMCRPTAPFGSLLQRIDLFHLQLVFRSFLHHRWSEIPQWTYYNILPKLFTSFFSSSSSSSLGSGFSHPSQRKINRKGNFF